jgi:hypothetical protein
MIQKVSDIEGEPEVGKFYMVPCVPDAAGELMPIIGPEHDDYQYIGLTVMHYHIDVRFASARVVKSFASEFRRRIQDAALPGQLAMTMVLPTRTATPTPFEHAFKCKRVMPDFPFSIGGTVISKWLPKLQGAYAGVSAKCGRCPHRGFSLKGLPVKDGKVICPGHGLQFNVNTGELVPR